MSTKDSIDGGAVRDVTVLPLESVPGLSRFKIFNEEHAGEAAYICTSFPCIVIVQWIKKGNDVTLSNDV